MSLISVCIIHNYVCSPILPALFNSFFSDNVVSLVDVLLLRSALSASSSSPSSRTRPSFFSCTSCCMKSLRTMLCCSRYCIVSLTADMKNWVTSYGRIRIPSLGISIPSSSLITLFKEGSTTLRPMVLNSEFGSLIALHFRPKTQLPIISVVNFDMISFISRSSFLEAGPSRKFLSSSAHSFIKLNIIFIFPEVNVGVSFVRSLRHWVPLMFKRWALSGSFFSLKETLRSWNKDWL